MNEPEPSPPYRIELREGRFALVDDTGTGVIICGDRANAEQYLELLNRAYFRGFKAGYRKGRTH